MQQMHAYLDLHCCLIFGSQLLEHVVLFGLEVGLLLDFGLVETVDDGVLAIGDQDAPDLEWLHG